MKAIKPPKIGLLKGVMLSVRYQKLSAEKREQIRNERLQTLLTFARENSPYYAKLYHGLPANTPLCDLPPVNKLELMAHFDEWVTDRGVRFSDVQAFMQDLDNVGRKIRGRYLVFSTSGSTGNPLISLADATTNNVMGAINTTRAFSQKDILCKLFARGGKSIGVFATGGFYLSNGTIRSRLLAMPWKKRQMALSSALLPIPQIVSQLNAFQPAMLGGYPSHLELLIEEQLSGRLRISPVVIMTGGEYLSEDVRERLSSAFSCAVQTTYSCTEGGTIANECAHGHFHINDDWVIVEPVDADNRPVPDGVRADKILLTNLFNYTQPFIRYEVTDRVVRHSEACACGNPSPWLTLEGRNDDVLLLEGESGKVKIAPLSVYVVLKEIHSIRRFQLVCRPQNRLELRLEVADDGDAARAFVEAAAALRAYLATQGVERVSLALSAEPPQQHPVSGKFKHILNLSE
jgi:phenylacetate-coenzyme A ligase PaaK-like adenylate-forming protein